MALGGGTFLTQNKVLPGAYINVVSEARATATLSDRGVAAIPVELDWGIDKAAFKIDNEILQKESTKYFGYDYTHEKLKGIRDIFSNAKECYFYRLNSGTKASNDFCIAKYSGIRGNDLKIVISASVDDEGKFDVSTLLDNREMDIQTVSNINELVENDYVVWKKDVELVETAGMPLTTGTNAESVTGIDYQNALEKLEKYNFNTLGCLSATEEVKDLFVAFTKRMRDEVGAKFQTVGYQILADYEGIISVENKVLDEGEAESSLVYWTVGASAGCAVNKSISNKNYDGEFTVDANYSQSDLTLGIQTGKFMFHVVDGEVCVLDDINTFVSFTSEKNQDLSSNQTIRVVDQIATDVAKVFNTRYIGKVGNTQSGRVSFWNDVVKLHKDLERLEAIEEFNADDIVVEKGETKKSVILQNPVTVVNAMGQLYMTIIVK